MRTHAKNAVNVSVIVQLALAVVALSFSCASVAQERERGYFLREAANTNWFELKFSLVLVFDASEVLERHSLVEGGDMETYPNPNPPAARDVIGALPADARAADASGRGLLPLLLILTLLVTGCLVVPIPVNRPVPGARTNITPQTVNQLGTGEVSRAEALL
jgi:hypothetical protein